VSERDVRALIAREYGLDSEAAGLLTGETLAEVEASAAALSKLLGEQREARREQTLAPDFFTGAAAAKAERKQTLLEAITGRAPQPRDERGRFASSGFDGGARQTVAPRRQSHDQWLVDLLHHGRADVGRHL
jgi:hypothetical protein